MTDVWGVLSSAYREVFGGGGATACTSAGMEDSCSITGGAPDAGDAYFDSTMIPSSGLLEIGDPLTFILSDAETCSGDTSGLSATFTLGDLYRNVPMTVQPDGSYRVTIEAFYWGSGPATITVTDLNRPEAAAATREIYGLPTVIPSSDPSGECNSSPSIYGNIAFNPAVTASVAYINQPYRIIMPLAMVEQCDQVTGADEGNTLDAYFIVDSEYYGASVDQESGQYYVDYTYTSTGPQTITFKVFDTSRPETAPVTKETNIWVSDPSGSTENPPASIVGPYAAEVSEEVSFLCPSADEGLYSYGWEFVDGSEPVSGPAVTHGFALPGTYQVRLTVASLTNPDSYTLVTQNITIVPVGVATPALSIVGPAAVHEDTPFAVQVGAADEANFSYSWNMGDGNVHDGAAVNHTYADPGTYAVILTATSLDDPDYEFTSPVYNIYVIADSAPLPNLSIVAPYSATINTPTSFQVADPNLADYDYSWNFNDGSGEIDGTSLSHSFTSLGTFNVILTARLASDPLTFYQLPQNISVVSYDLPNVGIVAPVWQHVSQPVDVSVPDPTPSAVYSWDFGDGFTTTGTAASHAYAATGQYEITLTGDNGGSTNSITWEITITP